MDGIYVIITGPSGAGKTTIVENLLEQLPDSTKLVTTTTRAPRQGEQNGKDYYFCSRDKFFELTNRGEFLEWTENYGNLYGSSVQELKKLLAGHSFVFSVLDTRGAVANKMAYPRAVTIFVSPQSLDDLQERITGRGASGPDRVAERTAAAKRKICDAPRFDYVVINSQNKLEETIEKIKKIIINHETKTP